MKCHFVVYRIDESRDVKHQVRMSVDTRKNIEINTDRVVKLRLYKDHLVIYDEILPITTYWIEHRDELDEKHADIPVEKRFHIRGVNQTGYPLYTTADWGVAVCGDRRQADRPDDADEAQPPATQTARCDGGTAAWRNACEGDTA